MSDKLIERLKKCQEIVGLLCSEGRPPKMSIPVSPTDEDIYIWALTSAASTMRRRRDEE